MKHLQSSKTLDVQAFMYEKIIPDLEIDMQPFHAEAICNAYIGLL